MVSQLVPSWTQPYGGDILGRMSQLVPTCPGGDTRLALKIRRGQSKLCVVSLVRTHLSGLIMGRPAIINPLAMGFYSVPEAARLIEVGSARQIYGWLRGYANRASGPLIERQFEPLDGKEEISFLDLMELRLIETLRDQEVRPRTIRSAIIEARKIFESERPFATDRILLKTDGKHVLVEEVLKKVAKGKGQAALNVITKQYEHYELMERL